jgi:CheY-like chemotaxis protein
VREAGDAAAGVEAFGEEPADLVLCDIFLPGGGGLDAIRELRRLNPRPKLVAMSGCNRLFAGHNILNNALAAGADEALAKPFSREALVDAVRRALADYPRA